MRVRERALGRRFASGFERFDDGGASDAPAPKALPALGVSFERTGAVEARPKGKGVGFLPEPAGARPLLTERTDFAGSVLRTRPTAQMGRWQLEEGARPGRTLLPPFSRP